MAGGKSTRSRIRQQVSMVENDLNHAMEHLQKVELYADGGSPEITETLPKLVTILAGLCKLIGAWRDRL